MEYVTLCSTGCSQVEQKTFIIRQIFGDLCPFLCAKMKYNLTRFTCYRSTYIIRIPTLYCFLLFIVFLKVVDWKRMLRFSRGYEAHWNSTLCIHSYSPNFVSNVPRCKDLSFNVNLGPSSWRPAFSEFLKIYLIHQKQNYFLSEHSSSKDNGKTPKAIRVTHSVYQLAQHLYPGKPDLRCRHFCDHDDWIYHRYLKRSKQYAGNS